jgi:dihydrodipicolinate synthase/N-acetylneuraminate lyase
MSAFLVFAALTTPFRADGWVDLDALRAHVSLLADDGVDGIVPAGTTGEGPLLEEAEVATVVATSVEAAGGRMEVIAHVGRASTPATLRLARAAASAGADGVIAITPYYYRHDGAALLRHYRALMEAVGGTPLYAYTFPDRSGNELPAEVVHTLAGEGLAGLKDSTRSAARHAEYLEVARRHEGLRVFVGSERLVLESLRGGGAGSITALANVHAPLLRRLAGEGSPEALDAVARAGDELDGLAGLKRAIGGRLAERGVNYPAALRPPL